MMIVRYCNTRGQIIDQIVLESTAYDTFRDIKKTVWSSRPHFD